MYTRNFHEIGSLNNKNLYLIILKTEKLKVFLGLVSGKDHLDDSEGLPLLHPEMSQNE